jgi:hypothetical protein
LEETQELITTLGQRNGSHIFKEEKPDVPEAVIQEAVRAVQERRLSLRFAASSYGMIHTAMHNRFLKKISNGVECNWRLTIRQIFNENQELMLVDYVIKCSKLNYGMAYNQIRQLAYEYARRLHCKFPSSWIDNKIAGIDCLQGFMKRHKNLSPRKPENKSVFGPPRSVKQS